MRGPAQRARQPLAQHAQPAGTGQGAAAAGHREGAAAGRRGASHRCHTAGIPWPAPRRLVRSIGEHSAKPAARASPHVGAVHIAARVVRLQAFLPEAHVGAAEGTARRRGQHVSGPCVSIQGCLCKAPAACCSHPLASRPTPRLPIPPVAPAAQRALLSVRQQGGAHAAHPRRAALQPALEGGCAYAGGGALQMGKQASV